MDDYVERIFNDFLMKISKSNRDLSSARNDLFEEGNRKILGERYSEEFHTSVERGIFVTKRVRPNIHQTVLVLSIRVKEPNEYY